MSFSVAWYFDSSNGDPIDLEFLGLLSDWYVNPFKVSTNIIFIAHEYLDLLEITVPFIFFVQYF